MKALPKISAAFERGALSYSKARFPADQGATVLRAIEHAVEQQYCDGGNPPTEGVHDVSAETPDPLPVRRADALAAIVETYLASDTTAAATADRYQVVVHVAANTLQDDDVSAETSPLGNADLASFARQKNLTDRDRYPAISIGGYDCGDPNRRLKTAYGKIRKTFLPYPACLLPAVDIKRTAKALHCARCCRDGIFRQHL